MYISEGEQWREIPGYTGRYSVSDQGRVYSHPRGRLLKLGGFRYLKVGLTDPRGVLRTHSVHILVLTAFIGPRPDGCVANHRNGDRSDNRLSNLEYVTPKENTQHAIQMGLRPPHGPLNPGAKLTAEQVREIRRTYPSQMMKELARKYNVTVPAISLIINRKTWKHLK